MRTDLTVHCSRGDTIDVAVEAPAGTTWAQVSDAFTDAVPGARPRWCGRRTLDPHLVLGRPPLVHGAMLGEVPSARPAPARARLEVVGGPAAGTSLALTAPAATIGRALPCELVLDDARVSRRHAVVTATRAGITVRDLRSTHGTWVDGGRVEVANLSVDSAVRVGDSYLALPSTPGAPLVVTADNSGHLTISARATLALAPAAPKPIQLPPAPTITEPTRSPVLAAVLPALLGVGLALVVGSWEFLAFALLAPVTALGTWLGEKRRTRRRFRHQTAAHQRAIAATEAEIATGLALEATQRRSAWPGPPTVLRIAATPTDRLWATDDALRLRIGLGTAQSRLRVERDGDRAVAGSLSDVPITVDLAAGWLGIAGPRHERVGLARWLVGQLVVRGSPLELHVRLDVDEPDAWRWARWLPHLDADTRAGVVLIADADRAPVNAPDETCAIVLGSGLGDLPSRCVQRIELIGGRAYLRGDAVQESIPDAVTARWAEQLARALAPLRPAAVATAQGMPQRGRLLDLVGGKPSAQTVRARWSASAGAATTVLGVGTNGPLAIDLDRDGPHALVAGSTGSGKSRLLQCLVAGLALAHPPAELSLLLVDYKGGAAFAECAQLPHTVGLVTDLDEHLTARVLTALESEVRRRERLLAAAGVPDLLAYRNQTGANPLARLVIVVDEFAALAEELGGFVPGLVGIARRGRSLGLHLVLATQRPAGVVSPEIRANTALRICLRVTTAAESSDVVDLPVAAAIDPALPGRGFARLGSGVHEFQTADVAERDVGTGGRIRVSVLDPWRRLPGGPEPAGDSDLMQIVSAARAAAALSPASLAPHRPWLPPLPATLRFDRIARVAAQVPIGLVDLPAEQRQPALTIDPTRGGIVVIAGRPRSGRSCALRTIALAVATRHSVHELEIHALDATGGGLGELRAVPHVGTVATVADGFDLAARLVERLTTRDARTLLLVDGWDQLVAAAEDHDAGRTIERLLTLAQRAAPPITTVVTGGRAALSPRLTALATTRFVLGLADPGEYAVAGIPAAAIPHDPPPGRGIRIGDHAEVQFALAPDPPTGSRGVALQLRPLPARVERSFLPAEPGRITLGVCSDEVVPVRVDPRSVRMLVLGPARSGRSTLLRTVLSQASIATTAVVAPPRSPLAAEPALPDAGLLLVDDADLLADTSTGDAIDAWLAAEIPGRAIIATARADAVATSYRGLLARLRGARGGILLHPGPADGDLFGVTVPRRRAPQPPGRGVLVPDPAWGLGAEPVPIQVALP
ncbi:MAG TPA: FtsK/SpoIIIE domain-containing protein [Jatrophihabitans sp.]|jgi:S-DNA-T family DNA segregation ATPase FtsK/SpoIIIE